MTAPVTDGEFTTRTLFLAFGVLLGTTAAVAAQRAVEADPTGRPAVAAAAGDALLLDDHGNLVLDVAAEALVVKEGDRFSVRSARRKVRAISARCRASAREASPDVRVVLCLDDPPRVADARARRTGSR